MSYQLFRKVSLLAAMIALCVVVLGAYVRLSDAGLGCPDWPGCYGTLTVPQSEAAIAEARAAFPNSPLEHEKAWKEMIHRYLAGGLGLLVLSMFVMAWKFKRQISVSPWLTTFLLVLIVLQAMLGMWTVTMLLKPAVVSAHLIGGMSTLAILVWIAHRHWGEYSANTLPSTWGRRLLRIGLLVLFAQIFLGGWTSTNYAALACTDFPTCHGKWMPDMDFRDAFHMVRELGQGMNGGGLTLAALTAIQWTHRVGAIMTLICLGFIALYGLKYTPLKGLSIALLCILLAQITIGIANLLLQLPLVLAVAHNLGAALLVVTLVMMNSKITTAKAGGGYR